DLTDQMKMDLANTQVNQTLLDDGTFGNILTLNKWANIVNDAWILGGVNRCAVFVLHSPRIEKNLWDTQRRGYVVTARELNGLQHFGYKRMPGSSPEIYMACDRDKAQAADLEEYHLSNALLESRAEPKKPNAQGLQGMVNVAFAIHHLVDY